MSKVKTTHNNFARGKIDHDMNGRFDLPIYTTGSDAFDNFISNFKGNAIFRAGFENIYQYQDAAFVEFKFNKAQNYIIVATAGKFRFLSYDSSGNFGWVLNGSSAILEIATPYTLAECKQLQVAQNFDTMYVAHPNYPPYKLTRLSANSFGFSTYARTGDPFTSANNYPACVSFYGGRLYFAATNLKSTTIWGSGSADYDNFLIPGSPTATSPLRVTPSEITQPIDWLFPGDNSLIAGTSEGLVAVNGGDVGKVITAETIAAKKTTSDGANKAYPITKDGQIYYAGANSRNVFYFDYDLLTEKFKSEDANFLAYDITLGGVTKLKYKKDRNDLIVCLRGDGDLLTVNIKQKENITGWHHHHTYGQFKDLAVITDNNGAPQLFALTLRNGQYYIERQSNYVEFERRVTFFTGKDKKKADSEAYYRYVAEQLKQCNYMDNAVFLSNLKTVQITFTPDLGGMTGTITAAAPAFSSGDVGKHIVYRTITGYESGRFEITGYTNTSTVTVSVLQTPTSNVYSSWYLTFQQITGLSQFNGQVVGVVRDGGFLKRELVEGGALDLDAQTTSVVIGYTYKGVIKSFSLGYAYKGDNTQVSTKGIIKAYLRTVTSTSGLFGTSMYDLKAVQQNSQTDLNYLPPLPMDGTTEVTYVDDNQKDKYYYIVQDDPGPFTATALILETNY